ncbi:MAG TPA: hypothetical protein VFN50_04010 [Acidimicrobiales bacterium]|nr:hypothetical protein [Acidimicrobiales bacterium]
MSVCTLNRFLAVAGAAGLAVATFTGSGLYGWVAAGVAAVGFVLYSLVGPGRTRASCGVGSACAPRQAGRSSTPETSLEGGEKQPA